MQVIIEPKKVIYTLRCCHNRAFIVTFYFTLKGTKPVKNGEKQAPGRTEVFTLPCNARTCLQMAPGMFQPPALLQEALASKLPLPGRPGTGGGWQGGRA